MKKIISIVTFLFCFLIIKAQVLINEQVVSLSLGLEIESVNTVNVVNSNRSYPVFGVRWMRFNDIGNIKEINVYGYRQTFDEKQAVETPGGQFFQELISTQTEFGVGYGLGWEMFSIQDKIPVYIKLMGQFNYRHTTIDPEIATSFSSLENRAAIDISAVPMVAYPIGESGYVSFGIPFYAISLSQEFIEVDNPILTEEQRRSSGFSFDFGPFQHYGFELGVGYRF